MNQSIDSERAVLGSILMDGDSIRLISLEPKHFGDPRNCIVYGAMHEIASRGKPIDLLTVSQKLTDKKKLKKIGGRSYLAGLTEEIPTSSHIEAYANIVKDQYIKRRLINLGSRMKDMTSEEADAEMAEIRMEDVDEYIPQNCLDLCNAFDENQRRLDDIKESGGDLYLRTGFEDIDKTIQIMQGNFVVIAARPGVGKTAIGLNMAMGMAKGGRRVLFITMEMSSVDMVNRMIAIYSDVDLPKVRIGDMTEEQRDRGMTKLSKLEHLKVVHAPMITTDKLCSLIERENRKAKLDAVFVDYIGILSDVKRATKDKHNAISKATGLLKGFALKTGIAVIGMAQLKRPANSYVGNALSKGSNEERMPGESDIKDSGSFMEDADTLLILHRTETTPSRGAIKIQKNRNGAPYGEFSLHFEKRIARYLPYDLYETAKKVFEQTSFNPQ